MEINLVQEELIKKIKKQKLKITNDDEMLSLLMQLSSDCKKICIKKNLIFLQRYVMI